MASCARSVVPGTERDVLKKRIECIEKLKDAKDLRFEIGGVKARQKTAKGRFLSPLPTWRLYWGFRAQRGRMSQRPYRNVATMEREFSVESLGRCARRREQTNFE